MSNALKLIEDELSGDLEASSSLDSSSESDNTEELDLTSRITGRVDSLKNSILSFVANSKYDVARRELKVYRSYKISVPGYIARTTQMYEQSEFIISQIEQLGRSKEKPSLPLAQKQRIQEKLLGLFESLKSYLGRIEQVENDLKVRDLRASAWVLRTFVICVFVAFAVLASHEALSQVSGFVKVTIQKGASFLLNVLDI
ncbi:MAG: hypothetical protein COT74_13090 [Bdellovibrionales bacterium CG10_big_fil_rev_8_21_14_0_10_45_34]|nr:MAG: hypothetical protein COT74_13090 [Bdellovibrionales bacterium CG10_big_fil_rev_8_21_14_0_10_45_34]